MKEFSEFEEKIFDSGDIVKKAGRGFVNNMGKIIALTVSVIMVAVTFTDITFMGIFTQNFIGSLMLLLTSSYIIYFSLEDAGENSGEESEEYKCAKARYYKLRDSIKGDEIEALRDFCEVYSMRDMEFRKRNYLISKGLSPSTAEEYKSGAQFDKNTVKILKKAEKIKPSPLNPKILLSRDSRAERSELEDPEKRKIPNLIMRLIPSSICMTLTLSVVLSAKSGMTASDVLNGILKLSALPLIGFRGYCAGYTFSKHYLSLWMETKANILEAFLKELKNSKELV